jgi:hypothetical protein
VPRSTGQSSERTHVAEALQAAEGKVQEGERGRHETR